MWSEGITDLAQEDTLCDRREKSERARISSGRIKNREK
jgi:hypothetical protein